MVTGEIGAVAIRTSYGASEASGGDFGHIGSQRMASTSVSGETERFRWATTDYRGVKWG